MSNEAIILCGKDNWKPTLKFGKYSLLDLQISWLNRNGYEHIILASDKECSVNVPINYVTNVEWSLERFSKGTGGAVMSAIDYLKGDSFYLMNLDDICFGFNPSLLTFPDTQARILVAKPKIDVGKVELRQDLVIGFKEKPIADYYCSAGHYYFKRHIVDKYFPDNGNLEDKVLPQLAKERILESIKLGNNWITINTLKDYENAKEVLGYTE